MSTIATRTSDDPRLLIIDTETTGLVPERNSVICELCLLEPNLDFSEAKVKLWFFELTEGEIARADPKALKINRYLERQEQMQRSNNWVTIKERTRVVLEILKITDGSVLCGDNVSFDANFLKHLVWRVNQEPNWDYHLLELESMTIGVLGGDAPYPWNGSSIAESIEVPFPKKLERHTAFGDAYWNLLRFRKLLRISEEYKHPQLRLVTE